MRRKNPLIVLGIALFTLLSFAGMGFSLFYFGNVSYTQTAKATVDDIEENVALQDAGDSDSYFDVYFFVQEEAANAPDPLAYRPQKEEGYGYWFDGKLPSDVTFQNNDTKYGYRKLTVYRSISVEQFNSIGQPRTTKVDGARDPWIYGFSGWTASKEAAQECIVHRQGDFKYVDAFTSLTILDQQADDGSNPGDNVIFLYPIYSTGKDYDKSEKEQQTVVEFYDNSVVHKENNAQGELFFSQEGTYNTSTYRYNNLTVAEGELNRYELRITTLSGGGLSLGWGEMAQDDTSGWSDSWYTVSEKLFSLPGTYNVAVKIFMDAKNFGVDRSHALFEDETPFDQNYVDEHYGTIDSFIGSEQAVVVNHTIAYNWKECDFCAYILVERVYEFHLMGGPYGTFNYNGDSVRPFYDGNIYANGYTPAPSNPDEFIVTYGLNNVFVDASGSTFDDKYVGNPDNNPNEYQASGIFKRNVFTIDAQNLIQQDNDNFWDVGIEGFSPDELKNLATDDGQTYSTLGESGGLLQLAVARMDASQTLSEYDYSLSREGSAGYFKAYRTMLKITETGYYNFRIQVTYNKSVDSEESGNIINYVSSVKVAVAPVVKPYFFKIFANDQFDHYRVVSGANQPTGDDTGFINHTFGGTNAQGNRLLYRYEFDSYGEALTLTTTFDVVDESGNVSGTTTFGDIIRQYRLIDHVTGVELTQQDVESGAFELHKNYVFYIQSRS